MSRLSQAETTAIAGALLGVPVLSPELQRLLDVKTDGNPFFLEEVVRSLYESGALERRGDTITTRCTSMRRSPRAGRLVVQGGLTTGLVHAVAMDLPGPGTVFLSQNWKFTAPVYIGDTITAEAEVISVHPSKPVTQLRVQITRRDGTTVLEGEAWCFTFADSGA
jgi:acyl dehydratase